MNNLNNIMIGKKSLLIINALVGVAAVGVVASVSMEEESLNSGIVNAAKLDTIDEGMGTVHNAFYVIDCTDTSWFIANGDNLWVRFVANDEQYVDLNLGTTVTFNADWDYSSRKVVAGQVPALPSGSTSWSKVLAARLDPSYSGSEIDWTKRDNQTGDLDISGNLNAIKINNGDFWGTSSSLVNLSAALRIEKWADSATSNQWYSSGVCVVDSQTGEVTTNTTDLKNSWSASALTYASIEGNDVKAWFSNLVAVAGGSRCEDLAARYDHILAVYPGLGLSNFASR